MTHIDRETICFMIQLSIETKPSQGKYRYIHLVFWTSDMIWPIFAQSLLMTPTDVLYFYSVRTKKGFNKFIIVLFWFCTCTSSFRQPFTHLFWISLFIWPSELPSYLLLYKNCHHACSLSRYQAHKTSITANWPPDFKSYWEIKLVLVDSRIHRFVW